MTSFRYISEVRSFRDISQHHSIQCLDVQSTSS